jgi:hypothetical protein
MRRNDQYVSSFKFILNIYICYTVKKIKQKVGLNFCAAGGGGQIITFFELCNL